MSHSVASPALRTELNKVPTRMAKVRTAPNLPVESGELPLSLDLLSIIEASRRAAGPCCKLEALSELPGNPSKGQLSGALNGSGGFNLRWVEAWPQEFWDEFIPRLRAERETSLESRRLRKVDRLKSAIHDLIDIVEMSA